MLTNARSPFRTARRRLHTLDPQASSEFRK
jgi:hypothetical protein